MIRSACDIMTVCIAAVADDVCDAPLVDDDKEPEALLGKDKKNTPDEGEARMWICQQV